MGSMESERYNQRTSRACNLFSKHALFYQNILKRVLSKHLVMHRNISILPPKERSRPNRKCSDIWFFQTRFLSLLINFMDIKINI